MSFPIRKWYVLVAAACILIPSCSFFSFLREPDMPIRVEGTRLMRGDDPYFFTGANLWYGAYLGSPGPGGDPARLRRELDAMRGLGITNLRVLAASELSHIGRSVTPAFQPAPGKVDDSLMQGLDLLLDEMGRRGMHAVLYLGNYWEWSGGMAQYNVWTGRRAVDPENPEQGWGAFMDFAASFYSNPPAVALHREYIRKLITRKNTVNGRWYASDPTIMSWQLANEPRPGRDTVSGVPNLPAFYRWIEETARFIHGLDTVHLVSSGSEGTVGTLQSREYSLAAFSTPSIDYLTFHLWPFNWGWFDPKRWEETLPIAEQNARKYIAEQLSIARTLGKPIVIEEFGLGRDGGSILPGTPTLARDRFYAAVFSQIEDSFRAREPIAGSNFWAWGGEAQVRRPGGMWVEGDPFVGDPPQEPQGQNSIFASDSTTLRIIGAHARLVDSLRQQAGLPPRP
jgi:mannan endo-1,4-beta-mannosidase